jgi:5'-3' exonuclease
MSGKGDTSDNIRGIKGLGEKTIIKLFPELTKQYVDIIGILDLCSDRMAENHWYATIVENKELIKQNVQLMQLTTPFISADNARIVREAIVRKPDFQPVQLKMNLSMSGIQVVDQDLTMIFKEYVMRSKKDEVK